MMRDTYNCMTGRIDNKYRKVSVTIKKKKKKTDVLGMFFFHNKEGLYTLKVRVV